MSVVTQGKLQGKVALVTGGAGGIGRATALAFVREGAKVAVVDINIVAAQAVADEIVAAGGEAIAIATDISRSEQVAAMVEKVVAHFGRLDIAFNNAALDLEHEPLHKISEEMFDRLVSVNIKGTWLCMKHEIEQMLKQGGGGAIVNTASAAGLIGIPGAAGILVARPAGRWMDTEKHCGACHAPEGQAPLPEGHPPKYRCLFCHKKYK